MNERHITDPVEQVVAMALTSIGEPFIHESEHKLDLTLDFYLPARGVYLECKRFPSERTARQLESQNNIILIQGMDAAKAFARMIQPEMERV